MREKLIELLGDDVCKHDSCDDCECQGSTDMCIATLKAYMADHLISNDVVPVVRCKDCVKGDKYSNRPSYFFCMEHHRLVADDDFCSCGERKDNVSD